MKFKIHRSEDGQFYFTIQAKNGKCIATSETMKQKRSCLNAIRIIVENASTAIAYEE